MIVNGVTLPDIPEEAKGYSHFLVYSSPTGEDGGTNYMLLGFSGECLVVKDTSPIDPEQPDVYPYWMYVPKPVAIYETIRDGAWVFDSEATGTGYQKIPIPCITVEMDGVEVEFKIFWADHVVMEATLDSSGVPVSTGIQYYPKVEEEPKPTRVSIGRSLVDGYAREVQRLTGTTEQMNAIQIREKLSTVKAAIKIGDTVLPPIPEDVLAEYPYVVIVRGIENDLYRFMPAAKPFTFLLSGDYEVISDNTTTQRPIYDYDPSINTWVENGTGTGFSLVFNGVKTYELLWSNHDIINQKTNEVYFSERQNFNGVWLPKIPDEFFGEKPYGFLFRLNYNGENQYFLVKSHGEFLFLPEDVLGQIGLDPSILGGAVGFVTSEIEEPLSTLYCSSESTNWMTGNDQENAVPIGQFGEMYYYELLWANHDIYEVASVDMNGGGFIPGDLYYPPLPTIDTDRVSMGYDLCDGIVEEVQRLSGESGQMNALHAYWKLTTVEVS